MYARRLTFTTPEKIGVSRRTYACDDTRRKCLVELVKNRERDASLSQGTSIFLKERLFDTSDPYQIYICEKCGQILNSHTEPCQMCGEDENRLVNIPYASKLLFQELVAMGIKINLK